jgi:transposase
MRSSNGTRSHLAVDADGIPLALRISAGNQNEQRHLLPLVDTLIGDGLRPVTVWADRGYWAKALRDGLRDRGIEPMISRRRDPGEPIPDGVATRSMHRGRQRRTKPVDPMGRHRWQIERTNAWIHSFRRIHIRRDVKLENYAALFTIALVIILARQF